MKNFYKDKRVLVTGHTGFKGAWLCRLLLDMGAKVYGYALAPERESLYGLLDWEKGLVSCYGDIRQPKKLGAFVKKAEPEVIFHLAAQPLVSVGYAQPVKTYETNLMGTVYLLEALRKVENLRSVVVVTTDKVYAETKEAAGEESPLGGFDPYANSKSCAELAAACYGRCFFEGKAALSRLRAGNVIGGGDFAPHRILPDCIRAAVERKPVILRHPEGVRPYQHVLEPLTAYLWTGWKRLGCAGAGRLLQRGTQRGGYFQWGIGWTFLQILGGRYEMAGETSGLSQRTDGFAAERRENTGKTGLGSSLECGAGSFCNGGMDEGLAERRRFDRRNAQRSGSL